MGCCCRKPHSSARTYPSLPTRKPLLPQATVQLGLQRRKASLKGSFQKGPGRGDNPSPPRFPFLFNRVFQEFDFYSSLLQSSGLSKHRIWAPSFSLTTAMLPSFLPLWDSRMAVVAEQASFCPRRTQNTKIKAGATWFLWEVGDGPGR